MHKAILLKHPHIKHTRHEDHCHLWTIIHKVPGLPWWLSSKKSACPYSRQRFDPWVGKSPWRRKWQPTPLFLPRKSSGQGSLAGYSPCGRKDSDTAEHAQTGHNFFFKLKNEKEPWLIKKMKNRYLPLAQDSKMTDCYRGMGDSQKSTQPPGTQRSQRWRKWRGIGIPQGILSSSQTHKW